MTSVGLLFDRIMHSKGDEYMRWTKNILLFLGNWISDLDFSMNSSNEGKVFIKRSGLMLAGIAKR